MTEASPALDPNVVAGPPVLSREVEVTEDFVRGSEIPEDLDPLADGILMLHQVEWIADKSDLKLGEKGRRTGITFAEALDDTLIAASSREAGGDNIFYIGDTKDKGREFIGYVAHFAKTIQGKLIDIEDGFFDDFDPETGQTRKISSYIARFDSGYRVEALSSRPENIRGLQGIVVIDEAAFHKNVREVIDAVNALLIWGGKVRVISTHNGVLNPFNLLIKEALVDKAKGKDTWSIHHIPFQAAIDNGLYKRVCYVKGREWSLEAQDAWEAKIRAAYGTRKAAMRQELDAIPAESEGQALTRIQIERCMMKGLPIVRWAQDDNFRDAEKETRERTTTDFLERILLPHLLRLNPKRPHALGEDFARKGDATAIKIFEIGRDLVRRCVLTIELHNVPYETQRDVLFYVIEHLPRFAGAAMDATGNGAYLAEVTGQRFGEAIIQVSLSQQWYKDNMAAYISAFEDGDILLPSDEDVVLDHLGLSYVNGIIMVPRDHRTMGADGFERHGDTAIAGALGYWVSLQDIGEYEFFSQSQPVDQDHPPLFEDPFSGARSMDLKHGGRLS